MKSRIMEFVMIRMLLLLFFSSLAFGQNLKIDGAWVRLVPNATTAAYMVISNPSSKPIKILGFSCTLASRAELHQTQFVDPNDHLGMNHGDNPDMQGMEMTGMKPVTQVVVPAKGQLEFKPSGMHLMLINLKQTLKEGQKVRIVLRLEGGTTVNVDAVVKMQ